VVDPGRLLVAVPGMLDPFFNATVVFLFAHEDGAAGLILNRPTDLPVEEAIPDLTQRVVEPRVVFFGGPVRTDEAIILGRYDDDAVAIVDQTTPEDDPSDLRVFAGYAGWSPGQLEDEIEAGGWFLLDPEPGDVLTPRPNELWRRVFARQEGALRRYRNFPDDPALN
jgi:putative transcriptional regulator